jgi:hypothetical protein
MTTHGHLAEVTTRQRFCHDVFTQPGPMADIAEFEQVATASFALASIARFSASLSKEKTTRQERDNA